MVFSTDLYTNLFWHIIICVVVLIYGLSKWDDIEKILVFAAIIYCLFFPYGHNEEIRNCQTEKGYTVSVIVKFKEPVIKLLWQKPVHVKVTSINGIKRDIKLQESSRFAVSKGTVFVGNFYDEDKRENNTLKLIL